MIWPQQVQPEALQEAHWQQRGRRLQQREQLASDSESDSDSDSESELESRKAGVLLPAELVEWSLEKGHCEEGSDLEESSDEDEALIGKTAGVYMAVVLQSLYAKIIELARRQSSGSMIEQEHIIRAVRNDRELNVLLGCNIGRERQRSQKKFNEVGEFYEALTLWMSNEAAAKVKYGHISAWSLKKDIKKKVLHCQDSFWSGSGWDGRLSDKNVFFKYNPNQHISIKNECYSFMLPKRPSPAQFNAASAYVRKLVKDSIEYAEYCGRTQVVSRDVKWALKMHKTVQDKILFQQSVNSLNTLAWSKLPHEIESKILGYCDWDWFVKPNPPTRAPNAADDNPAEYLLMKLAFQRLVREISFDYKTDERFGEKAMIALAEAVGTYLARLF